MANENQNQGQKPVQKRVCFAYNKGARHVIAMPNPDRKPTEPVRVIEFEHGFYETDKPEEVAALRQQVRIS